MKFETTKRVKIHANLTAGELADEAIVRFLGDTVPRPCLSDTFSRKITTDAGSFRIAVSIERLAPDCGKVEEVALETEKGRMVPWARDPQVRDKVRIEILPGEWVRGEITRLKGERAGGTDEQPYQVTWEDGTIGWYARNDLEHVYRGSNLGKIAKRRES